MCLPKIPILLADPRVARACRPGVCFFWLLFFAQAKKSDSRTARKLLLFLLQFAVAFALLLEAEAEQDQELSRDARLTFLWTPKEK
ncbi:hypothetical protein ACFOPN_14395 [Xanthomonas hyacinthi]|uniref:hypothetical protein n=1 Tax=Xanthomonas hyacinthi TaxID=56455 RepID=UPI0036201540